MIDRDRIPREEAALKKEIRLEPEDYQAILDKMDDGIFIVNRQGSIIAVNKAVEKNGGKKMHELIGRNIDDLVKEGYCTEFVSRRVIESGREEILVQHTKDNKELLVTGRPYYKNGQLEMVVACERDVTELAKTKEKLSKVKIMNEEYQKELEYLRKVNSQSSGVVSVSRNMKQTIEMAKKVARLDTTVLIQGESGTGKEVLAKLICSESPRSMKPFIKVNCGAIPENLLESEMFGYVEGAFTGAKKAGKEGYFGMANGGTIFLDEVNELPFNLQVKLLRVIQEREMMPVGSDRPVKLDIRIIASTNKDLKKLVARGKFRQDLYYRISVVSINIPPLRERREDIVQLVKHFIGQFNVKYGLNKRISAKAQKLFLNYDWPGNVRELENMVECLIAVTEDDLITESDARLYINGESALRPGSRSKDIEITGSMEEMVGEYESHLLKSMYDKYGSTAEMAKLLRTTRSTINRKIKKYGIRENDDA